MPGNNWEENIRKKMVKAEIEPKPEIWDQIASQLQQPRKSPLLIIPFWYKVGIASCIFVGVLIWIWLSSPYIVKDVPTDNIVSHSPIPPSGSLENTNYPSSSQDTTVNVSGETEELHINHSSPTASGINHSSSKKNQPHVNPTNTKFNAASEINRLSQLPIDLYHHSQFSFSSADIRMLSDQSSLSNIPLKQLPLLASFYPEHKGYDSLELFPLDMPIYSSRWNWTLSSAFVYGFQNDVDMSVDHRVFEETTTSTIPEFTPDVPDPPQDTVWRSTFPRTGLSLRLGTSYRLASSWSIESGIYFSQSAAGNLSRVQRSLFDPDEPTNASVEERTSEITRFRLRQITLPLWLSKHVSSEKWHWQFSSGSQLNWHTQHQISLNQAEEIARLAPPTTENYASYHSTWSFAVAGRVLLSRRLTESWFIYTGPEVSYRITDFSNTDNILFGPYRYQLGWSLGVNWQRKKH